MITFAPTNFSVIHNKDYSVVKTSKAGQLAFFFSLYLYVSFTGYKSKHFFRIIQEYNAKIFFWIKNRRRLIGTHETRMRIMKNENVNDDEMIRYHKQVGHTDSRQFS